MEFLRGTHTSNSTINHHGDESLTQWNLLEAHVRSHAACLPLANAHPHRPTLTTHAHTRTTSLTESPKPQAHYRQATGTPATLQSWQSHTSAQHMQSTAQHIHSTCIAQHGTRIAWDMQSVGHAEHCSGQAHHMHSVSHAEHGSGHAHHITCTSHNMHSMARDMLTTCIAQHITDIARRGA